MKYNYLKHRYLPKMDYKGGSNLTVISLNSELKMTTLGRNCEVLEEEDNDIFYKELSEILSF